MKLDSITPKSLAQSPKDEEIDSGWDDDVDGGWDDARAPLLSSGPTSVKVGLGSLIPARAARSAAQSKSAADRSGSAADSRAEVARAASSVRAPTAGVRSAAGSSGAANRRQLRNAAQLSSSVPKGHDSAALRGAERAGAAGFKFPDTNEFRRRSGGQSERLAVASAGKNRVASRAEVADPGVGVTSTRVSSKAKRLTQGANGAAHGQAETPKRPGVSLSRVEAVAKTPHLASAGAQAEGKLAASTQHGRVLPAGRSKEPSASSSRSFDSLRSTLPYAKLVNTGDRPTLEEAPEVHQAAPPETAPAPAAAQPVLSPARRDAVESPLSAGAHVASRVEQGGSVGSERKLQILELSAVDAAVVADTMGGAESLLPSNLDSEIIAAAELARKRSAVPWLAAAAGVLLIASFILSANHRESLRVGAIGRNAVTRTPAPATNPAQASRLAQATKPMSEAPTIATGVAEAPARPEDGATIAASAALEAGRLKEAFAAALADGPDVVHVTVNTTPSAAAVFDARGKHLGAGTVDVPVPQGRERRILIFLQGYHQKRMNLDGRSKSVQVVLARQRARGAVASDVGGPVAAVPPAAVPPAAVPPAAVPPVAAGSPVAAVAPKLVAAGVAPPPAPGATPARDNPEAPSAPLRSPVVDASAVPSAKDAPRAPPDNPFAEVAPL